MLWGCVAGPCCRVAGHVVAPCCMPQPPCVTIQSIISLLILEKWAVAHASSLHIKKKIFIYFHFSLFQLLQDHKFFFFFMSSVEPNKFIIFFSSFTHCKTSEKKILQYIFFSMCYSPSTHITQQFMLCTPNHI